MIWLYIFAKLFVADIDRAIVRAVAPNLLPLVDYRLVLYLVLVVIVVSTKHRWWRYYLYIIFFPLILLIVYPVVFLIKHRSWTTFLAALQLLSSALTDITYNLLTKAIAVVAAIFIVKTDAVALVAFGAIYVACLMLWSLRRRSQQLIKSPSFVEMQRRAIHRIMHSSMLHRFLWEDEGYTSRQVDGYSEAQASSIEAKLSLSIGLNKLMYLWAYQLDRYRRRVSPAFWFSVASWAWLFAAAWIALTLLNVALLKLDPSQYITDGPRPLISVVLYAFSTFSLGQAGGMVPTGQFAYFLQLSGVLTSFFVGGGLALNLVQTYRRERDDAATTGLITELRKEAQALDEEFARNFDASMDEGLRRLHALDLAAAGLVDWIVRAIPPSDPQGTEPGRSS